MKAKLVKIGNSMGIRLPKVVLQECGFQSDIDMVVQNKSLIVTAPADDRTAWHELFQEGMRLKPIKDKGEWEW